MRGFPAKPLLHHFMSGAMNPLVLFGQPDMKIFIGCLPAYKPIASPESFPDKMIGPLHLTLYPGGICRRHLGAEPVMEGKARQGIIEFLFPRQFANIYVFHPVI